MPGLLIAAPSSGSGKTTVTLGLLRALSRRGVAVRGAKSGPDYIDPRFHEAACGAQCFNLDAWAMGEQRLRALAGDDELLVVEGAMGLFDGAPPDGRGASADLARLFDLPVALVVDAARMAQSVAPLVAGFAGFDPRLRIGGVILNRVGSARHEAMLRRALTPISVPVLGALPRDAALAHPSRHLGLVQAHERPDLESFLDMAAGLVERHLDIDALLALSETAAPRPQVSAPSMAPPAQRIAVARDAAFAFAYPHLLEDWRAAGAEILPFSPLADEAVPEADLVMLPGGYPELHAGRLAAAQNFMQSLRIASYNTDIYGECGGYMVLGQGLTDAEGAVHRMAGLLDLSTSFAQRRLHLGYRNVTADRGPFAGDWSAHEFHYATTLSARGDALFIARDAEGTALPPMGLRAGRVCGSFAHLIDRR
ncbi:cobyrinic acid a,c-diamide synthase [Limimaricola soesokkakensis]|uniref:Hydrogenobyrinate a,c-diamide synthase n=1 Tax=Limimaricola soesokkakensis TaxID=1343159 RepID=A0A1X6ZWM9_9RHOB|nr:cobyrinate a,c-diamide synthase [Limimaricola soesokkakensis]PSK83477.1 cobyrinic acid a,c-diamide synthase [Limimaricola soesokkakensis]SLN63978.1 Cobyrinic acid A,C-diamide synthase [Limimaricola soesokkakensis]